LHFADARGRAAIVFLVIFILAGCGSRGPVSHDGRDGAPTGPIDLDSIPDAVPRDEPRSRYGNPETYEVFGKRYRVLPSAEGYVERGIASWYGTKFHGRLTSTREPYDMYAMTAAHKTLPLPSYARVTNLRNGRSIVVRINDRGPFHDNRVIDLSFVAAKKLGVADAGTGLVEVRTLDPGAPSGPDPILSPSATSYPIAADIPSIYLQVGAFGNRDNADRLRGRLESILKRSIRIQEARAADRSLFRVQVGPLVDAEQTDSLSERLAALGFPNTHVVVE